MTTLVSAHIPATHTLSLTSAKTHRAYTLSVALPPSYDKQAARHYPVIYLLDANWYFGMVVDITRSMHRCDHFPEVLVVGVGYPTPDDLDESFTSVLTTRRLDLTPIVDADVEQSLPEGTPLPATGGAGAFLDCLETELIPHIEGRYRCDPAQRVLAGHSFGGLFTLFTLFQRPQLFSRYLAASPSLWYGERVMFQYEEEAATRRQMPPVRLYMAAGEAEESVTYRMVSHLYQFVAQIEQRGHTGIALTRHVFAGCDHCGATAPAFQRGLQELLAD
jgi:uncharacterized protein